MTRAEPPRLVHLGLRDLAARFALSFAVDQAGWTRVNDGSRPHARVADRLVVAPDQPALDVLVLAPTPANSRRGIDAFTSGLVRAVVASTDPQALPDALEAGRKGRHLVSGSVLQAAQGFPSLTPRLEHTLLLLVRGRANRDIARELGQSEATTKRDVAELLHRFDAPNRVALAATAWRLGLSPDARPDMLQA
jgi:DNA-binding NarL/FixJ family response regulator